MSNLRPRPGYAAGFLTHPRSWLRALRAVAFLGGILLLTPILAGEPLRPRAPLIKPERIELDERHSRGVIYVKFRDDLNVRLRDGRLDDFGTNALAEARPLLDSLQGATWRRRHQPSEDKLAELRDTAQRNLGRAVADMNVEFWLTLPAPMDAAKTIDALNALANVEIALPGLAPAPPPLPPDFQSFQGYLNAATAGVGALPVWTGFDARGEGIRIVDVEYDFNPNHLDLPPISIVGSPPVDAGFGPQHATAVLGSMASLDNGWGTTGI